MSNSERHDRGVEAVGDYLAQDNPLVILTEPGRPRTYPGHWSWDSPDKVAMHGAYRVICGDYKCSVADVKAPRLKSSILLYTR